MTRRHIEDEPDHLADDIFATFCRASPSEARELALQLPETTRAQLALFCYARGHLRQVGMAIAGACTEGSLMREGGNAGHALFVQSSVVSAKELHTKASARPVSLATGALAGRAMNSRFREEEALALA